MRAASAAEAAELAHQLEEPGAFLGQDLVFVVARDVVHRTPVLVLRRGS